MQILGIEILLFKTLTLELEVYIKFHGQSFHNLRKFPQIRQLLWGRGANIYYAFFSNFLCLTFSFKPSSPINNCMQIFYGSAVHGI